MKKRLLSTLLLLCMVLTLLPTAVFATNGDGTAENAYLLSNADDLKLFRDLVNSGNTGICAVLVNDIDLNHENWTPIGPDRDSAYTGTFDGQGHTIKNLSITGNFKRAGLFGCVKDGAIRNLTVAGSVNCTVDYGWCGGIAGYAERETIEHCASLCDISFLGTDSRVGGIVGYVPSSSHMTIIRDCYHIGNVTGTTDTGGICGWCMSGSISNCYQVGEVTAERYAGEIVGDYMMNEPSNCYYLSDTDTDPAAKTVAEFSDGTVLKLLINNRAESDHPWADECKYLAAANRTLPVFTGQGDAHTHIQPSEWEATETEHWQVCKSCGATICKAPHNGGEADCASPATRQTCGKKYGEKNPQKHSWSEWTSNGNGTHTHTCFNNQSHTETENCSGGTANCHEKAICTVCGQAYGAVDPASHDGGTELKNKKDPTSTKKGYTGDTYCKGCGEKLDGGKEIPATGKFDDVPAGSYYEDAVIWAAKEGITDGTDTNLFSTGDICTRAQAVTFLWRAAGSPAPKTGTMPFADVPKNSYYHDAVLWAVENGITNGTGETTFSPEATCTRAQIVTFLWRAEQSPAAEGSNPFADVAASEYYAKAVQWAVENGITNGTGETTFSPNAGATRAHIVTFVWRCRVGA